MEKNTKILLGIGAAIAAYLILKPKKAAAQTILDDTPSPAPKPCEEAKKDAQWISLFHSVLGEVPIGGAVRSDILANAYDIAAPNPRNYEAIAQSLQKIKSAGLLDCYNEWAKMTRESYLAIPRAAY
jgi:hypothetical protein